MRGKGYLSKAVHSTVIADPNNLLVSVEATVLVWGASWIVDNYRWGTTLDYVYGDVVSPGECQDLWLSTPDPGITDGGTIHSELSRGHEAGICGADTIFTIYRG
jgi:hypothetical protein